MKRTVFGLLILVAMVAICGKPALRSFAKWNKEQIADTNPRFFFLESYSNGLYTLRHDHKLYTARCAPKPMDEKAIPEAVEIQCDELKDFVGKQIVGGVAVYGILLDAFDDIHLPIDSVRPVN